MKALFTTTITILLLTNFSIAQQYYPPVGTDVHNSDLDKFVGTWRWVSGTDTIVFIMKKENLRLQNTGGMDFIVGYHLYKKGNDIIVSSIQYSSYNAADGYSTFTGLEPTGSGFKKLQIVLSDSPKNKTVNVELSLLDSANTQMQFTRLDIAGGIRLSNNPILAGFTLPDNFVLNKVIIQQNQGN